MNPQDRIPKRPRIFREVDDESSYIGSGFQHPTGQLPPFPRSNYHHPPPVEDHHLYHSPRSSSSKNKRDRSRGYQETHRRKLENYVCQLEAHVVAYQKGNAALARRSKEVEYQIAKLQSSRFQHHMWLISRLHGLFYQGLSNQPQSSLADKQRSFCRTYIHPNYHLERNVKVRPGEGVQAFGRDTLVHQGLLYQDIFPSLMWETKTLSIDGANQDLVSCTVEFSLQLSHRVLAQVFPRCPVELEGETLVITAQVLHQIFENQLASSSVEMNLVEAWLGLVKGNVRLAKDICDSGHMLSNGILLSDR